MADKKKPPAWFVAVFVGVVALCFGGGAIALFNGDDTPVDPVSADQSISAEVMCEEFIEKRLKAPATAEYPDPNTSKDGATYTVTGAVDSENSFGAKVRNQYTCVVKDSGDDTWTLVDLKLSE